MSFPTCDEVIEFLKANAVTGMAAVVERLRESEQQCRQAAEANLRAYYALKDQYEPRPKPESFVNWTGD